MKLVSTCLVYELNFKKGNRRRSRKRRRKVGEPCLNKLGCDYGRNH